MVPSLLALGDRTAQEAPQEAAKAPAVLTCPQDKHSVHRRLDQDGEAFAMSRVLHKVLRLKLHEPCRTVEEIDNARS